MKWHNTSMIQAIEHAQKRRIAKERHRPKDTQPDEDVIVFTDGTAIAVHSNWQGPLSEVTPDVDAMDPGWRIYQ